MADETTQAVAEQPAEQPTEEQLIAQMNEATKSGDFKAVAKVAQELVKFQKAKEAAELAAKQAALEGVTKEVGDAILKAIKPFVDGGKLDIADGIWFTMDFGDKSQSIRLMKNQAKKASGGNGGGKGKKFDVDTTELLERFGSDDYKDGMTYAQAWESNTDKNWRYGIRTSLLKKAGITS